MAASATPRVLVVGAGLAGLVAGFRLERAGADVTLLEAADRPGGRLGSDSLEGMEFEPASPIVPSSSPVLFGLLRELGLEESVRRIPLRAAVLRDGRRSLRMRTRVEPGSRPWGPLAIRRLRMLLEWFGPSLDPLEPERAGHLDDRSVADFARLYLGGRVLDQLYAPLLEVELGLDAGETSRQLLMLLMSPWGDLDLARTQGMSILPGELAKRLCDVRTAARVESVNPDGRGVRLDSGEQLAADAVLVATAASHVPRLVASLCPAEERFLAGCRYQQRLQVTVALRERVSPKDVWIAAREGGGLSGTIDVTPERESTAAGRGGLLLLLARPTFARELWHDSDVNLCNTLLGSAEAIHPGLRERVVSLRVHRIADAIPSFAVGHYRGIARLRAEQTRRFATRRIMLCGDYLVAPHAEGAAVAGTRAAAELLAAL